MDTISRNIVCKKNWYFFQWSQKMTGKNAIISSDIYT